MTTAESLEGLTDRGKFELLATSVLRKVEPKYAPIIHVGINANGETIVSPLDGLHLIPGSDPPHYVFVQHTTTDRTGLRGKWLSSTDSDICKAANEAMKIRRSQSGAIFTVVLTTNQRLNSDLPLDIYAHGRAHGLIVDIWEQSRLSDFLDSTADGHWLRKHYLGIEIERLSTDLLHHLGRLSVELYRQHIFSPGQVPWVHRGMLEDVIRCAIPGGPNLCFVAGSSGYGKSVITAQALDRWLSAGSFAVWLPASFLNGAVSIESALNAFLKSLHPSLQPDAGKVAIGLASSANRLMICLDDINRTPEAQRILRLALNLAVPLSENGAFEASGTKSDVATNGTICQLIPVWTEQLSLLQVKSFQEPWIRVLRVGELSGDEASAIIGRRLPSIPQVELNDYAARLNHDPFLVGLFAAIADDKMDSMQLRSVADDAIGQFLEIQLRSVSQRGGMGLLTDELRKALLIVAGDLMLRRNLRPTWENLTNWFGEDSIVVRGMRQLLQQATVCTISRDDYRIDFRHDRIRERLMVDVVSECLKSDSADSILKDPYFAPINGKALARTEISEERLEWLRAQAPWLLFEAIRNLATPSSHYRDGLCEAASKWALTDSRSAPESVLSAVCRSLVATNSPKVLPIIHSMNPNRLLWAAGLRNGSAEDGVKYMRAHMRGHFEPGMGDALRDSSIEHALQRHQDTIAKWLRGELSRTDLSPEDLNARLALLGHCRFRGFDEMIRDAWSRHKVKVLWYALWAAARCPLGNYDALREMLTTIDGLPVRSDFTQSLVEREWGSLALGWAFKRGITAEALTVILELGKQSETLAEDVRLIVDLVDDADAFEFLIRRSTQSHGWRSLLGIGDSEPQYRPSSRSSIDRMRSLWESENEPANTRCLGFSLWLEIAESKDTDILAHIRSTAPFYRYALQHRIKIGDQSSVPELIALLRSNDMKGWWWELAHRIWCKELFSLAFDVLERLKANPLPENLSGGTEDAYWNLSAAIVTIPPNNGEELLRAHWEHLKRSPVMIAAAIRIGSNATIELATSVLSSSAGAGMIFDSRFLHVWEKRNAENPLSLRHFQNLSPFLDQFGSDNLWHVAHQAEQDAEFDEPLLELFRREIIPRISPDSRHSLRMTDEILTSALDREFEATNRQPYFGYFYHEKGSRPLTSVLRQVNLVDGWLANHRTIRGLEVAAAFLKHVASRPQLGVLDRYEIEADSEEIARIKSDAHFSVYSRTLV